MKRKHWYGEREEPESWDELVAKLNTATKMPGWTNAWTMPIKARIDMLSTGVRTPVGIKIFGSDLEHIESAGREIEAALKDVPGTRSVLYERALGGTYVDILPKRTRSLDTACRWTTSTA